MRKSPWVAHTVLLTVADLTRTRLLDSFGICVSVRKSPCVAHTVLLTVADLTGTTLLDNFAICVSGRKSPWVAHTVLLTVADLLTRTRYLIALEFVWVLWNVLSTAHAGCIYMVFLEV